MAVTINFYDEFMLRCLRGEIILHTDTFKYELHNNLTFSATHTSRSDVSATALATGNGYTNPGQNLTSVTLTESGGVTTFDAANVSWSASGGSIGPATDGFLYSDTSTTPSADLAACNVDFDGAQTAGDGTDFINNWNASGIFTV